MGQIFTIGAGNLFNTHSFLKIAAQRVDAESILSTKHLRGLLELPHVSGCLLLRSFRLRSPTLADAAGIARLVRESRTLDENSLYAYLLLCHHFLETCAVAEREGELIGFATAYRPPGQRDTLFVWQVAVAEAARGKGLASRLLTEILARESCAGVQFVEATISPSNTASQRLFHSLARQADAECRVSPLFPADLFGDSGHESEELYRVGPLSGQRENGIPSIIKRDSS